MMCAEKQDNKQEREKIQERGEGEERLLGRKAGGKGEEKNALAYHNERGNKHEKEEEKGGKAEETQATLSYYKPKKGEKQVKP